mgnify:CR=1 FL=1
MKLDRLANTHADLVNRRGDIIERGNLRIATVEYSEARDLCVALELEKLPTIHMYMPSNDNVMMQKVQDFATTPKEFHVVQDLATYYLDKQKRDQQLRELEFEAALARGHDMIQSSLASSELAQQLVDRAGEVYAASKAAPKKASLWGRIRKSI